jgi:hypothetical protein
VTEKTFREILLQNETFPYGKKLGYIQNSLAIISKVFFDQFPSHKPENKLLKKMPVTASILKKL